MTNQFDCDETGNMNEYVGCKVERNFEDRYVKLTQPVMIQSFRDEFGAEIRKVQTPAESGSILPKCKVSNLGQKAIKKFRSGVGKLLHMMRWSRPDILNAVRELSKHMKMPNMAHLKAMYRTMDYVVKTPKRGLTLKPTGKWDGIDKNYEFRIRGKSDADYAKDPDNRKSISGTTTFLEDTPVAMRCGQQNNVTLSTSEAELMAAVQCAQDMLYVYRILTSLGLKVKTPMLLEIDNKGTVDLANNWSIGGRTRHIEVRQYFLRDLKEEGLIITRWCPGTEMSSDLFTKNLDTKTFEKHVRTYCGDDEYYIYPKSESKKSQGESVGD
jgi:hypothetical protein